MQKIVILLIVILSVFAQAEEAAKVASTMVHGISGSLERDIPHEELRNWADLINPDITDEDFNKFTARIGAKIHISEFHEASHELLSKGMMSKEESESIQDEDFEGDEEVGDMTDKAFDVAYELEDAFDDAIDSMDVGVMDSDSDKFWRRAKKWFRKTKKKVVSKVKKAAGKFKGVINKVKNSKFGRFVNKARHHASKFVNKAKSVIKKGWTKVKAFTKVAKGLLQKYGPGVYAKFEKLASTLKGKFEKIALKGKWAWKMIKSMKFFPKVSFPVHGNWCGPKHGGKMACEATNSCKAPIDYADACCKQHDFCYEKNGGFNCLCEKQMYACQAQGKPGCYKTPGKSLRTCVEASIFIHDGFKNLLPCKCNGSWKMPSNSGNKC